MGPSREKTESILLPRGYNGHSQGNLERVQEYLFKKTFNVKTRMTEKKMVLGLSILYTQY